MGILVTFLGLKLCPKVPRKIEAGYHIYEFSQCYQHIQLKKITELSPTTGKQLYICGSGNRGIKKKKITSTARSLATPKAPPLSS